MNKHTPGPWTMFECLESMTAIYGPENHQIGWVIQEYNRKIPGYANNLTLADSDRANARLVAAAPDLLEACRLALEYLQKSQFSDGDAYPALLKAIEKADGTSN